MGGPEGGVNWWEEPSEPLKPPESPVLSALKVALGIDANVLTQQCTAQYPKQGTYKK